MGWSTPLVPPTLTFETEVRIQVCSAPAALRGILSGPGGTAGGSSIRPTQNPCEPRSGEAYGHKSLPTIPKCGMSHETWRYALLQDGSRLRYITGERYIMTTNMLASNPSQQMPWRPTTTLSAVLLCFIAIALAGMLIPTATRLITWIVSLVLLASIVLIVGRGVTGRWFGFLIDERNKMSLSRFQAVLWSLLILSAFLAAALINLHLKLLSSPTDALAITIPAELLALLGISGTSLVGAQLILHAKSQKLEQIATHLAANQADWYDMFKG